MRSSVLLGVLASLLVDNACKEPYFPIKTTSNDMKECQDSFITENDIERIEKAQAKRDRKNAKRLAVNACFSGEQP